MSTQIPGTQIKNKSIEAIDLVDNLIKLTLNIKLSGNGSNLTTGSAGYLEIPANMTITGWTIVGNTSGSIVIDVKKSNYSNFPTTSSIAGSEKPTLSSAVKNQNLTLSSWTTNLTTGDILQFYIESVNNFTNVLLSIRATKN